MAKPTADIDTSSDLLASRIPLDCVTFHLVAKEENICSAGSSYRTLQMFALPRHTFMSLTIHCRRRPLSYVKCIRFTSSITDSTHTCVVLISPHEPLTYESYSYHRLLQDESGTHGSLNEGTRDSDKQPRVTPWNPHISIDPSTDHFSITNKTSYILRSTNNKYWANRQENKAR